MAKIIKAYTPITAGFQEKDEIHVPMLIDEYVDKIGTGLFGPYICVVNDSPISRKHWGSLVIQKNDVVMFIGFPQGGGEGGSSPIKAIATIALVAAAMTIPGMQIFAGGIFAAGTFGGALMSGTIMFGGSYLLNLAFPPVAPEDVTSKLTKSGTSLSTYNINDRGNSSALNNVITVQYGRIINYPKYAMQKWVKYIDNEQYAYLLFCQGQGEYSFEGFSFGSVPSTELDRCFIETFASDSQTPSVNGEYFYDNVFTSEQVRNIEVTRVDEYITTVPGFTVDTITTSGIEGSVAYYSFGKTFIGFLNTSKFHPLRGAKNIIINNSGTPYDGEYDLEGDGIGDISGAFGGITSDIQPVPSTPQNFQSGTQLTVLYPLKSQQLIYINSSLTFGPVTIPFENGIYGNEDIYDGFVAGDIINVHDYVAQTTSQYTIKQSYYYDYNSIDYVAYEFLESVPSGDKLPCQSYMQFVPSDISDGYLIPSRYEVLTKIEVDISFPQGVYKINETTGIPEDSGVKFEIEYKITDEGYSEDVNWNSAGIFTLTESTKSAINKTYEFEIPETQSLLRKIRVRVNRDFGGAYEFPDSSNTVSGMYFMNLKVFLENTNYYGDVTMIAVKTKVSNSLVQASLSKFNTISTRKLPKYTTSWSANTATRNPAWAIADACRNSEYSLGIPDADIDIDELVSLAAIWESRGDYCDGLFENKEVFWDSLRKICKVGRAQPLMVAGSVSFVRDQPKTIPTQVFTSDNIQSGSFNVDYIPFDDDTPNSVELEYFDEDKWSWKKTLQTIPEGPTTQPASIKKWGITTEDHAIREAKYESACNAYRRKLPNFITELEGRILKRLDYISISSPRVGWGISGHIVNVDGNELELSEPVEFVSGSYYIAFREKNGSQDGPYIVTEVVDEPKKVLMATTPPAFIYTGYEYEKTHFQFGQGDLYDRKALVSTVQPQQLESVQITCIVDDERVYTADGTTGI